MLPAIKVTGGSFLSAAAGWTSLDEMGVTLSPVPPSGPLVAGQNVSGCVLLMNTSATAGDVAYFAFSNAKSQGNGGSAPTPNPGATRNGTLGDIPLLAGAPVVVAQPPDTNWWGASAAGVLVVPCELLRS